MDSVQQKDKRFSTQGIRSFINVGNEAQKRRILNISKEKYRYTVSHSTTQLLQGDGM